jgi:hypothetical protein
MKNRSDKISIKTIKAINNTTNIITQTNKTTNIGIINIKNIITSSVTSSNSISTGLSASLYSLSSSLTLLSSSVKNLTFQSPLSASKTIFYHEQNNELNSGNEISFNGIDTTGIIMSEINFKNNVSVFLNGVRLISDHTDVNSEVETGSSNNKIKFNVPVPAKSIITLEIFRVTTN